MTDWQTASGMVGQFITVIRIVLWIAIIIIFLVTLVIINNSMLLATMERVGEIGTIRAIGAGRSFVLAMFLLETTLLGIGSGLLGGATGAGLIHYLGSTGIPAAGKDILIFLFSGPRLVSIRGSHTAGARLRRSALCQRGVDDLPRDDRDPRPAHRSDAGQGVAWASTYRIAAA